MKVALIYPPTADPTMPYISVPILTGYLRAEGVEVLPVDANIEAYDQLLTKDFLTAQTARIGRRLGRLKQKKYLDHADQLAWIELRRAAAGAERVCSAVDDAVAVMRDRTGRRFYDPLAYETARADIEQALALISAAYTPLTFDFADYRTPFALLNPDEIVADAAPDRNPFHDYFQRLGRRLAADAPGVIGISIVFVNQVQSAFALAMTLRRLLPAAHLIAGGPAITQILLRRQGRRQTAALGPFHSAVLFEGEKALLEVARSVERGEPPAGVIRGATDTDPGRLPAPDFTGLPLEQYLSPEPVLPYDPTRGCYWGRCAFCHYGLTEGGTASYRERPVDQVTSHLQALAGRHGCRVFYFSEDTIHPRTALALARQFASVQAPWQWASDIRPEPLLTADCCRELAAGGALAFSLGVESAAERVLKLIDKGLRPEGVRAVIDNLAAAGIAVEAMTFTGFPTETAAEALATIRFLESLRDRIALFICGEFHLTAGSLVARHPKRYGLEAIWTMAGDTFIKTLFYATAGPAPSLRETQAVDRAVERLSRSFWLHRYPWAGSLSTAHTLLWYSRSGPAVFREAGPPRTGFSQSPPSREMDGLGRMARQALDDEAAIWQTLINEKRTVSRRAYNALAAACPKMKI